MPKYVDWFKNRQDVAKEFEVELPDSIDILVAAYGDPHEYGYYGQAVVYYVENRQLFEVHASHCSCYGLESQWEPKPMTWQDLQADLKHNCGDWPALALALQEELKEREARHRERNAST
jgi:hypothetical protein